MDYFWWIFLAIATSVLVAFFLIYVLRTQYG
jgi:hypothetical protein